MSDLNGKKVAVLVETEYIPEEIQRYHDFLQSMEQRWIL